MSYQVKNVKIRGNSQLWKFLTLENLYCGPLLSRLQMCESVTTANLFCLMDLLDKIPPYVLVKLVRVRFHVWRLSSKYQLCA